MESAAPRAQTELGLLFESSPHPITLVKLSDVTAVKEAELKPEGDRLVIQSSGTDPSLLLPGSSMRSPLIARITMSAPIETTLQIFYLVQGITSHDEAHSFKFPLKEGRNVIYCALDDPRLAGVLRFDPGAAPGEYVLEAIELREYVPRLSERYRRFRHLPRPG